MQSKFVSIKSFPIMNITEKENNLDRLDKEILAQLQKDGRKSFTELAEEMGVAVNTIRNRYTKLVQDKVLHIIGWTDPVRTGYNSYARLVIKVTPPDLIRQVAKELLKIPEVTFVAITSGSYSLEINMMCQDNAELTELLHQKVYKITGVSDVQTTVYFEVLKWASHDVSQE